jgi:very-short-patch-repair endonuclease
MSKSNLQYCFEDHYNQQCWIGMIVTCSVTLDAAEQFVTTLAEYSEAGVRAIQVVLFERGQGSKTMLSQGQRHYNSVLKSDEGSRIYEVNELGLIRITQLDTLRRNEIFIPAFPVKKGQGGTVEKLKHGFRIQSSVTDRIVTAFAELMGRSVQEFECSGSELIKSRQRGWIIRLGEHEFPLSQPSWESPIEELFWQHAHHVIPQLIPQYVIQNYRVDLAIPEKKIAIELDGQTSHKTPNQRTYEAQRERDLQEWGWQVIRFTGTEIHRDVSSCIEQLKRIAKI